MIEDGAVLQTGIGGIPDAVLPLLTDRQDLGVHSELVSDGVVPLIEAGVITGATDYRHKPEVAYFMEGFAWLAQIILWLIAINVAASRCV